MRVTRDIAGFAFPTRTFSLLELASAFSLPLAVCLARATLPPWLFMWVLAGTCFAVCKWLTWRIANPRSLAYAAWIGMDAAIFSTRPKATPPLTEWLRGLANIAAGALLVWAVARHVPERTASVWAGMTGLILMLHFGTFHLLALAWQLAGRNAEPLMRQPLKSRSVAEFWNTRWNTAFHSLAERFVFRPVLRGFGNARVAVLATFLVSGLVHDFVISVPARGGYGLPTLYFLLQAGAVLLERSHIGRAIGLKSGWRGHLFAIAVVAAPAGLIFHHAFTTRVMLPFLQVIGGL